MLAEAGVDKIFGIPGGGATANLVAAARDLGVEFVLVQHETSAVIMAGIYGQRRGTVGVAISAIGPGVANLVNGAAHAFMDRLPVLILADRYPERVNQVALRQRLDHLAMMAPVTKLQLTLHENTFRPTVRRAVRTALAERPGPVFLDFPNNVAALTAEPASAQESAIRVAPPPQASDAVVAEAASLLSAAERPVILAGLGALGLEAGGLAKLAATLRAPVFVSPKAKGAIAADDPWFAGIFMGGKLEQHILDKADRLLLVGYDPVELLPRTWHLTAPVITVDVLPNVEEVFNAELEVTGHLPDSVERLGGRLANVGSAWSADDVAAYRQTVQEAIAVDVEGLSPDAVIQISRELAPRDAILSTDVGANKLLILLEWDVYGPNDYLMSNGLGTMGFAVPGAIGAKLADPDRPVLCLCGDSGFLMRVQELLTARRQNCPIVFVIFADSGHTLISVKQKLNGLEPYGTAYPDPDYASLAAAFGLQYGRARTPEEFRRVLADALARADKEGTLIEANVNTSGYMQQFNAIREL